MRTFLSILTLFFISTTINAQFFTKKVKGNGNYTTTTRNVTDYNKVSIAGNFDVKLFSGKEGEITVTADENLMEYIITEIKDNNTLVIKTKKDYQINPTKTIKITIPITNIEALALAGSGDVFSEDELQLSDLKISLAGSGDINLTVYSKSLTSKLAGSGNFNGSNLTTDSAKINIAGSGNVKINVVSEINASTAGSGNITYTGNPTVEKTNSVGSGNITKKSSF